MERDKQGECMLNVGLVAANHNNCIIIKIHRILRRELEQVGFGPGLIIFDFEVLALC